MHLDEKYDISYAVGKTLTIPASATALCLEKDILFVGSVDGTLCVYDLSTYKVIYGIKDFKKMVSSIVCITKENSSYLEAWIAHGFKVSKFNFDYTLQDASNALVNIDVRQTLTEKDGVNEIALNEGNSHLSFTLDSGAVGVIDLSNYTITRMHHKHPDICASGKFIPGRPRDLVTAGKDSVIYHFDVLIRKVLSKREIMPFSQVDWEEGREPMFEPVTDHAASASLNGPNPNISQAPRPPSVMSTDSDSDSETDATDDTGTSSTGSVMAEHPAFVRSLAISSTGVIAAGTGDGRVMIGFGGENLRGTKVEQREKRWEGLIRLPYFLKPNEGYIAAMAFVHTRRLAFSTHLGLLSVYDFVIDPEGLIRTTILFEGHSPGVQKAISLVAGDKGIILAGKNFNQNGIIEIWKKVLKKHESDDETDSDNEDVDVDDADEEDNLMDYSD